MQAPVGVTVTGGAECRPPVTEARLFGGHVGIDVVGVGLQILGRGAVLLGRKLLLLSRQALPLGTGEPLLGFGRLLVGLQAADRGEVAGFLRFPAPGLELGFASTTAGQDEAHDQHDDGDDDENNDQCIHA